MKHATGQAKEKKMDQWKAWARKWKGELFTLYYAYQDLRTPLWVKLLAIIVVAYAFSPIDLIPDFIPVLGYLDDVILVPLGIALTMKFIPNDVLEESRQKAQERMGEGKPKNWFSATMIILIWIIVVCVLLSYLYRLFYMDNRS